MIQKRVLMCFLIVIYMISPENSWFFASCYWDIKYYKHGGFQLEFQRKIENNSPSNYPLRLGQENS